MPPPTPARSSSTQAAALLAEADRLRARGLTAQAVERVRQAAGLAPNDARVFFSLGVACFEAGRHGEAAQALRRSLQLQPNSADAAWRLGQARAMLGDMNGALAAYQQAVTLKPSHAEARFWLAALLAQMGRIDEAVAAYRRVRSSAGATGLGWIAEARALGMIGDEVGAERAGRRAVAVDPKNSTAQETLGNVHVNAGRFEEAMTCFERALDLSPGWLRLWYDLTRCRRMTEADRPLITRMQDAISREPAGSGALALVYLALGKAMDDLGDPAEAMKAFDAADAVRPSTQNFDLAAWRGRIDAIIARFTPEVIATAAEIGSPDETPLFILGMPRSGTTLMEQIISNHPDVTGGGELAFWGGRTAMMEAAGDAGMQAPFIGKAAEDFLTAIRPLGPTSARITDKMPFNYLCAGLIHLAFPRATIIHCRRRPIDTALSIHQTWFAQGSHIPGGGEALVGYYRQYERLMAHWRAVLPAERFVEVDYEALIAEPELQVRRVIAAIGLDWNDACLTPESNARVVRTASKWQARQPIYAGSVDRWRRYEPYLGALRGLLE